MARQIYTVVLAAALAVVLAAPAAQAAGRGLLQGDAAKKCTTGASYNDEHAFEFDQLRDRYSLDGITVGLCDWIKVIETQPDQKCRYDETHPRNRPVDTMVLRGLASGSNYQNWYAYSTSAGYLECSDGNTIFDVKVRVLPTQRKRS